MMVSSLVKVGPHLGIVIDVENWEHLGLPRRPAHHLIRWLPSEVNDLIATQTTWLNLANADCTVLVHRDLFGEEQAEL